MNLSSNDFGFYAGSSATVSVSRSTATNNNFIGFVNAGGVFKSLGSNLVDGTGTDTYGTITVIPAK